MRTLVIACAFVLGVGSLGSVSVAANKVDICHFKENKGIWQLTTVNAKAVDDHLEDHDDALPGGTTSQTSTVLDADCVEVTCPCSDAFGSPVEVHEIFLAQEFDGVPVTTNCNFQQKPAVYRRDDVGRCCDAPPTFNYYVFNNAEDWYCVVELRDHQSTILINDDIHGLTDLEVAACHEDIRSLIAQLTDCP